MCSDTQPPPHARDDTQATRLRPAVASKRDAGAAPQPLPKGSWGMRRGPAGWLEKLGPLPTRDGAEAAIGGHSARVQSCVVLPARSIEFAAPVTFRQEVSR